MDKEAINKAIGETYAGTGIISIGQWRKTAGKWSLEIIRSPIPKIPQYQQYSHYHP